MATPGIGDPYWFEWYVGLKNIINMLNPDNGIEYVIFQCSKYNTIDDVVVGYKDGGHEICYQIKHEIFTSKTQNGLLAHEGALVEFGGDFAHINGASLFKVVGGNMFFYLCNSQIAPSEIWREGFKCVPDHTSPYCWRDENGNIVLRFERIASPIREAMHEKYYRQPILFRWLCNSEWLKETLCKHNLHLRYVSRLESIP